ncbi:MAG: histidine phosphatase family protein [Fibrobacter sp.]|nr:histidine phosphatase family protein [Fibrobacter sp.]
MKNKLFKKAPILLATFATAAALGLTACGDDSSSGTPTVPSDPTVNPGNSDEHCEALTLECGYTAAELCAMGMAEHCTTSDHTPGPTPSIPTANAGCAAGDIPTPVMFPQDTWTDIGEVYKNIQCNEKVIFIVRHAEREAQTGKESPLTQDGVEAAVAAGQQLIGPGEFKFVNSGFLRTFQTVYYMAIGRGQYQAPAGFTDSLAAWTVVTDLEDGFVPAADFPVDTITQITDSWFLKDKELRDQYAKRDSINNVNEMYSKWIYEGLYEDVYYNLDERCEEVLKNYLVKDYGEMPKYTLMGSHDQFLMPLTSWATKKAINLIYRDYELKEWRWVGFLSGLAIIINDKNEIRYAPIKGMEQGYGR